MKINTFEDDHLDSQWDQIDRLCPLPQVVEEEKHLQSKIGGKSTQQMSVETFDSNMIVESQKEIISIIIEKYKLSATTIFTIKEGRNCDLSNLEGRVYIPDSKNFKQVKYLNQHTGRSVSTFVCLEEHGTCMKVWKKWHNLFDHLRIHTGERPFECPVMDCRFRFNQSSNQKKHIETHKGVTNLKCKECAKLFHRLNIVIHFETYHRTLKAEA